MTTPFVITSKDNPAKFYANASKGDAEAYQFDFSPWQDDNSPITSATWTLEGGNCGITNKALTAGVASALLTFSAEGRNVVSVLAVTSGGQQKKVWLEVVARDQMINFPYDGYGCYGGA